MGDKTKTAADLFSSGYNCAQAILAAFCESYGLDRATALKLTSGLSGGCPGDLYSAVSGATMVIGLKHGQSSLEDKSASQACYLKTNEYLSRFREKNASAIWQELIGHDLFTKEGKSHARGQELFQTVCAKMVTNAAELLEELGY